MKFPQNLAAVFFLATLPLAWSAGPLYTQDFEGIFDEDQLKDVFVLGVVAGNAWRTSETGGVSQSVGLQAPGGQTTVATARTGFEGFAKHPVITLVLDTRLSLQYVQPAPFSLPFSVSLKAGAPDGPIAAAFDLEYASGTFGETTVYNINSGPQGFVWNPASLMEGYEAESRHSAVRGWLRWQAVWTYSPEQANLALELSVFNLGEHGEDKPKLIQTWKYDPVSMSPAQAQSQLHLGVRGRARDGFGIISTDNWIVTSGKPSQ